MTAPVSDERVETVARELANHQGLRGPMDESRPDVWQNRCECGWDDGDERPGWRERYRLHVAAAAIAALPASPSPAEESVHEVDCPSCGATIRACMADADPSPAEEAVKRVEAAVVLLEKYAEHHRGQAKETRQPFIAAKHAGIADGYRAAVEDLHAALASPAPAPQGEMPQSWLVAFAEDGVPNWAALRAWAEADDADNVMAIKARARQIAADGEEA